MQNGEPAGSPFLFVRKGVLGGRCPLSVCPKFGLDPDLGVAQGLDDGMRLVGGIEFGTGVLQVSMHRAL